ncbi:MAG: hypothetical protein HY835_02135, partial [Anaerolineae bacterium]|nr:hypothetical protein [Anaerolineae bacterium]
AQLLGETDPQAVTEQVLEHLEGAAEKLREIFGRVDASVMQQTRVTLRQSDPRLQPEFIEALGEETYEALADQPLENLDAEQREIVESVLGWWRQNEIYRSLLLSVISELWVDYLTRVEALRVSIGLEAYAQRDPLVQYKSRASELFGELLVEVRTAVIGRMFNMRPRAAQPAQGSAQPAQANLPSPAAVAQPAAASGGAAGNSSGKKKHRKR